MPFIVFEGLDGSGKSTLLRELEIILRQRGVEFITTREPGGTGLAEDIRNLLLQKRDEPPTPTTEMFLYSAARAQHVETVIRPALRKKQWVLCDRFAQSTYAFQVGGRGLSEQTYDVLTQAAVGNTWPDLWVLVDVPVATALSRMQKSRESLDRMESEKTDFHERVRAGYLNLAEKNKDGVLILDGQKSVAQLTEDLTAHLSKKGWLK